MAQRKQPSDSSFDTGTDRPSMGDSQFVEGQVRLMLDEAKTILFEAKNPQGEAPGLVAKWAAEFSPANAAYEQTLSVAALNAFLRPKGLGTDDPAEDAPVRALVAETIRRFVETATGFHEGKLTEEQLSFGIETAVEDFTMFIRGLDNPAD